MENYPTMRVFLSPATIIVNANLVVARCFENHLKLVGISPNLIGFPQCGHTTHMRVCAAIKMKGLII